MVLLNLEGVLIATGSMLFLICVIFACVKILEERKEGQNSNNNIEEEDSQTHRRPSTYNVLEIDPKKCSNIIVEQQPTPPPPPHERKATIVKVKITAPPEN